MNSTKNLELTKEDLLSLIRIVNLQSSDFKSIFSKVMPKQVNRLAIAPCCFYIADWLPELKKCFNKIYLIDNYKKGVVHGIPIVTEDQINPNDVDVFYFCINRRDISTFSKKIYRY